MDEEAELLKQFSVLRTNDPAEACETMRRRFGVTITAPTSEHFFVRANRVELPNVVLYFCGNRSPLQVTIAKGGRTVVLLCLRGRASLDGAGQHFEIGEGEAFVCAAGRESRLQFASGTEQLILRIPQEMLDRTLTSLTGFQPRAAIDFEPRLAPDDPHYAGFRELLMLLAGRLDPTFSAWPKATLAQLEQACITSFLHCSRHNFRRFLGPSPSDDVPLPVRCAEHYAESHCEEDVTIDDMAGAAHVSVSTLTRAFLKHRGYTPSAFIKRVRLSRAKTLLETGAATTVIGVALRCGFTHPGRFANDYRESFGESPTDTLRRIRSRPNSDDRTGSGSN
jgi:AraC-like DNA-binding protein